MPDFEGANIIELQPLDTKVPYQFLVTVCTTATANDGFLPYGYSAASAEVTVKKYPSSTSATSAMVSSASSLSVSSNVITAFLTYPVSSSSGTSILGPGTYHMTFKITPTGSVSSMAMEANFNRVYARDK